MVSQKNKQRRQRQQQQQRKQSGGSDNVQSVGFPIQWFNPDAKVPAYYAPGDEMLTKQYMSAYGPIRAVSTTQPNSCMTEMGPDLAPFSPYEDVSNMTGGSSKVFEQIVNPLTNRKVSVNSRLGKQILKQYIQQINH